MLLKFNNSLIYCSRTFGVCFARIRECLWIFAMCGIYSPRFSVLCSLAYRWEVLMSVQVVNFENSHIQGSRAFAYMFAQFSRMFAIFATWKTKFLLSKHTLVGIIRVHLGYFAMFNFSLNDSDPCIHAKFENIFLYHQHGKSPLIPDFVRVKISRTLLRWFSRIYHTLQFSMVRYWQV